MLPNILFLTFFSPTTGYWTKMVGNSLKKISGWSHRLPFYSINFLFLKPHVCFPQILVVCLYGVHYLSLVHDLHVTKLLDPVLLSNHFCTQFCVCRLWLASHLKTWFTLMSLHRSTPVTPCTLVGIFSWTVLGSLLPVKFTVWFRILGNFLYH